MMIRKYCLPGERLPRFYGVAWYDPMTIRAICYPIPVNWFAWAIRHAWLRMTVCPMTDYERTMGIRQAYRLGWEHGRATAPGITDERS